jgi:hypothetical protein
MDVAWKVGPFVVHLRVGRQQRLWYCRRQVIAARISGDGKEAISVRKKYFRIIYVTNLDQSR